VLSVEVDAARRTVLVAGEVDLSSVERLVRAADRLPGDGPIRIDLRGVSFIDSTGIRGLVRIASERSEVVLVAPSRSVRRVLDLLRLEVSIPLRVDDDPPLEEP
jgi:anti-sigma B factor antagonist